MCQCPERGNLHFYKFNCAMDKMESKCVNALKGATFISTEDTNEEICFSYSVSMP